MDELSANEFELLVPSLIEILDAVHRVDISETDDHGLVCFRVGQNLYGVLLKKEMRTASTANGSACLTILSWTSGTSTTFSHV